MQPHFEHFRPAGKPALGTNETSRPAPATRLGTAAALVSHPARHHERMVQTWHQSTTWPSSGHVVSSMAWNYSFQKVLPSCTGLPILAKMSRKTSLGNAHGVTVGFGMLPASAMLDTHRSHLSRNSKAKGRARCLVAVASSCHG